MDGIFGWLGEHAAHLELIESMGRAMGFSRDGRLHACSSPLLGVAAGSRFGKAATHVDTALSLALHGRPTFLDGALASLAHDLGPAAAAARGWESYGTTLPAMMSGSFALAVLEPDRKRAFLAIDRMGVERLCYARRDAQLVFGASAQSVARHPAVGRDIDPQSIYDYLYFQMIPSPRTLYRGVEKLLPGQFLLMESGQTRIDFYWQADYTAEAGRSFESYRSSFRELLSQAVGSAADGSRIAAFLSGGTDSSTVLGALTEIRGAPADTFSIGFDAKGFDEMEFARCAAERFRARAHEIYVKPQDVVAAIPIIAAEYDEPFGNSSAVPTYFCAKAAREAGFDVMLAGDGGDEIFGGNARYAKQKLFEAYFRLPAPLRRGCIEPLAHIRGANSIPPLRKLRSYVDQANVRLPLRLEAYNFLHRSPLAEIFEPEFIAAIDPASTDRALGDVYGRTTSDHFINRMMHLDLKFTLADNDLRKVGTMTEAAGVEVRYPLLDDRMVAFANHLPVDYKVRGTRLRWFFKEALRDLLPEKIIGKSKHGFGLPFGLWLDSDPALREFADDSLTSFKHRGYLQPAYVDHLLHLHQASHPTYYGVMVWIVMMLETWLRSHDR
jgi:asparagine synthase (glutamine-hydrolysing)